MKILLSDELMPYCGEDLDRSPGIHVSQIIRDLAFRLGHLDKKWKDAPLDPARINPGFLFERALEMAFKDRLGVRIGEVMVDGIAHSLDGVLVEDNLVKVDEFKCTWKSMKNPIENQWLWITQLLSYCHALDTPYAVLRVLWVNGDYSYPLSPVYQRYDLKFTKKEIEKNWGMILLNKPKE